MQYELFSSVKKINLFKVLSDVFTLEYWIVVVYQMPRLFLLAWKAMAALSCLAY